MLPLENPEKAIPRVVLKLTKELGIATKSWMHSFHNFSRNILRKFYTNTTWSILWVTQKKKYSDLAFLPAKIDFFRDPWNCNSDKVRLKFVDIPSEKRHVFFFFRTVDTSASTLQNGAITFCLLAFFIAVDHISSLPHHPPRPSKRGSCSLSRSGFKLAPKNPISLDWKHFINSFNNSVRKC